MKRMLSCCLQVQRGPGLSPSRPPHLEHADREDCPDLRNQNPTRIPRLEVGLRGPRGRPTSRTCSAILGNDVAIKSLSRGEASVTGGCHRSRPASLVVTCPSEENNKVFGRRPILSYPDPSHRTGTSSLWSRTQKSTPRPAAGGTPNLIRTANLAQSQISKNAFPAIRLSKTATSFSLVTHLDAESAEEADKDDHQHNKKSNPI